MRDYLNTMMKKAGQFDKVTVEYADIDYATKFKKGPDGNYYGTVTFVQKMSGFIDGNIVYCDSAKRYVIIVIAYTDHCTQEHQIGTYTWRIWALWK